MRSLLLLAFILPLFVFSQSAHYDSLYNQGLISKSDWQLLRNASAKPVDSNAIKIASYDSLYAHGQISKSDRDLLTKQLLGEKGPSIQKDTLGDLLDQYDSDFRAGKLSVKEHQRLVDEAKARYKPVYYSWQLKAAPVKHAYDPEDDRAKAKNKTAGGVITMVLGVGLAGVGIGLHVHNGGATIGSVICGSLGGVFLISSVALLIRGGVLRNRADRFERDKLLLGG
jgi:hypothetical protein